ncbi:hypothetical protein BJV74DRAFT_860283 [Russula compacta]|nr:hypothetical protein BJV74DRAFT_860283 [Russula compacta]
MMFFKPLAALFVFALSGVSAAPVQQSPVQFLSKRDVWAPRVITPNDDTVWKVGSTVTATWDISSRPAEVTNPIGTLLLGHINADGSGGENLDVDHPLAQNFTLAAGQVSFPVPSVSPGSNYIVVLIGDSGNASDEFTITD